MCVSALLRGSPRVVAVNDDVALVDDRCAVGVVVVLGAVGGGGSQ